MRSADQSVGIVNRDFAAKLILEQKFIILITENFSGHRMQWLQNILNKLEHADSCLMIFSLNCGLLDTPIKTYGTKVLICSEFKSKVDLAKFLKNSSSDIRFITWDGDNWLLTFIRYGIKSRVLIMRPYVDYSNFASMLRTILKLILCLSTSLFHRIDLAYLGIPLSTLRFRASKVVDDELELGRKLYGELYVDDLIFDKSEFNVILPGFITKRKNPHFAIKAIERARSLLDLNIKLIFLGSISSDCKSIIESEERDWLDIRDEIHEREDFLRALARADLIILPYNNRASSSIALESLSLGTQVLMAKDRKWKNFELSNAQMFQMSELKLENFSRRIGEALKRERKDFRQLGLNYRSRQLALDFLLYGCHEKNE